MNSQFENLQKENYKEFEEARGIMEEQSEMQKEALEKSKKEEDEKRQKELDELYTGNDNSEMFTKYKKD